MTEALENGQVRWSLDLDSGRWGFGPLVLDAPAIVNSGMGLEWRSADGRLAGSSVLKRARLIEPIHPSPVQAAARLSLECRTEEPSLLVTLDVEVPADLPLVLLRLSVQNRGPSTMALEEIGMLSAGRVKSARRSPAWVGPARDDASNLRIKGAPRRLRFYANGWQGWSPSGGLSAEDRQPWTRLGPITAPIFHNPTTGRPNGRGHFVSDMFGVLMDTETRTGLLAGFASQTQAFGSLEASLAAPGPGLRLWECGDGAQLPPGAIFQSDWACVACVSLDSDDPLGPYLNLAGQLGGARVHENAPLGWSSWYTYFESVDAAAVDRNLAWLIDRRDDLPLQVFQIDDGFETQVGDWEAFSPGFPRGVKPIADRAAQAGLSPGLWLAPFITMPRSRWAKEHPGWVLRSRAGRPVSAGYNWSTFTLGLDPTHPEVQEAVYSLVRKASAEWGFGYLKFDFLYAGALPGMRYDPTRTRAQALRSGLELLRQAAGDETWLLGCGCPLGSGIGIFDSMRIGPDVAPRWTPAYQGVELYFGREPSLPSARNSLQAILARAMLNRRWWVNDPDCLLARGADSHLTTPEVQTLLSVAALSGGALIDSDDLPSLEPERVAWLERMTPALQEQAHVHAGLEQRYPHIISMNMTGCIGDWCLAAIINWDDRQQQLACRSKDLGLDPEGTWWGVDYWREELLSLGPGVWSFDIPPHGVHLMSLRARDDSTPAWVGDTLHISQGKSVSAWEADDGRVRAVLTPGRRARGRVWLGLPSPPSHITLDGADVAWSRLAPGVYRLSLEARSGAVLEVRLER